MGCVHAGEPCGLPGLKSCASRAGLQYGSNVENARARVCDLNHKNFVIYSHSNPARKHPVGVPSEAAGRQNLADA